eukprot:3414174-Amphidinium_carterae.2
MGVSWGLDQVTLSYSENYQTPAYRFFAFKSQKWVWATQRTAALTTEACCGASRPARTGLAAGELARAR